MRSAAPLLGRARQLHARPRGDPRPFGPPARLLHAAGFSGLGFALMPALGEAIADLVRVGSVATSLAGLDPARFA